MTPFYYKLGGPETKLPYYVESFLSWSLCISCLSVSGYHYIKTTFVIPKFQQLHTKFSFLFHNIRPMLVSDQNIERESTQIEKDELLAFRKESDLLVETFKQYWIPLTTTSRYEIDRLSSIQRHDQLCLLLRQLLPNEASISDLLHLSSEPTQHSIESSTQQDTILRQKQLEDVLIETIRNNEVCRRLVTLMMRPNNIDSISSSDAKKIKFILDEYPHLQLPRSIAKIWLKLLAFETELSINSYPLENPSKKEYKYEISLIIPAYREQGVITKIEKARYSCSYPSSVEVVFVDAGLCPDLESNVNELQRLQQATTNSESWWGNIVYAPFYQLSKERGIEGRGPCLSHGARVASGKVLTFLHSDTLLPCNWDLMIKDALYPTSQQNHTNPTSCAFSFGIDISHDTGENVSRQDSSNHKSYYPPGIKAVEVTANLRSHWYALPYGDQCISLPAQIFHYIGGFPEQCLFEGKTNYLVSLPI